AKPAPSASRSGPRSPPISEKNLPARTLPPTACCPSPALCADSPSARSSPTPANTSSATRLHGEVADDHAHPQPTLGRRHTGRSRGPPADASPCPGAPPTGDSFAWRHHSPPPPGSSPPHPPRRQDHPPRHRHRRDGHEFVHTGHACRRHLQELRQPPRLGLPV